MFCQPAGVENTQLQSVSTACATAGILRPSNPTATGSRSGAKSAKLSLMTTSPWAYPLREKVPPPEEPGLLPASPCEPVSFQGNPPYAPAPRPAYLGTSLPLANSLLNPRPYLRIVDQIGANLHKATTFKPL